MVGVARAFGIDALGIDKIAEAPNKKADLKTPLLLPKKYKMITCIEVAEHIPELNAPIFLNNITNHLDDGGILVFTAASPGQEGEGHLHLKPALYWRTVFDNRGLQWKEELTNKLKIMWMTIPMPMMWLPANVQVFKK